jgi:tRNA pseudouridine55 synthase
MKPPIDGLLVLDKPAGITSRTAVDRALKWFPRGTRMGHTGTLDPLATGVLVLCLGNATRLAEYVQRMSKTYRASLLLGARSETDDADGTITAVPGVAAPAAATVAARVAEFVGDLDQVPPAFSAAKVTGRRAYDLARAGQEVTLEPRRIKIYRIDILHYAFPLLELEVHCGKGTYIRSLARDLGERLGCGGLVGTLRRTNVGPFTAEKALTLETEPEEAQRRLLPAELALAELPRLTLPPDEVRRLGHGQAVRSTGVVADEIAVFDEQGGLVGVARWDQREQLLRPEKMWRQ